MTVAAASLCHGYRVAGWHTCTAACMQHSGLPGDLHTKAGDLSHTVKRGAVPGNALHMLTLPSGTAQLGLPNGTVRTILHRIFTVQCTPYAYTPESAGLWGAGWGSAPITEYLWCT